MGTIFFIDDDLDTLDIYQKATKLAGHKAMVANNGKTALKMMEEDINLNLIVLDFRLPDMNGLTLIEKLREKESTKETPIIMLSASYPQEMMPKARKAGADMFLSKPFSIDDFFSVIDKYL